MSCLELKRFAISLTGMLIFSMLCKSLGVLVAEDGVAYESTGSRDPFVPLVTGQRNGVQGLSGVESVDDLFLEGVIYDPDQGSLVIVNGVVLAEGERQANVRVLKVEQAGVTFEINEHEAFKPIAPQKNTAI